MSLKMKNVLFVVGIALLSVSAVFSIIGMSNLFASAKIAVIILFSFLELAKVTGAAYMHKYWKKIKRFHRVYLFIGLIILMIFTSIGIYGFLTNAYAQSYEKINSHDRIDSMYTLKINQAKTEMAILNQTLTMNNERIMVLSGLRKDQENRLNIAMNSDGKYSLRNIRTEIQNSNDEILKLQNENKTIMENVNKINTMIIDTEKEKIINNQASIDVDVGPLRFLANVFNVDMKYIINGIVLFVIFVFDPMGLILVVNSYGMRKIRKIRKTKNGFRRSVGRPKGSKNKPKEVNTEV